MKNIYEILKEFGLELPAEKKADFQREVLALLKKHGKKIIVPKQSTIMQLQREMSINLLLIL